jgi:hypothetical protein
LKELDLHSLATLWQTSARNELLRASIEGELKNLIPSNNKFSREYLFQVCKIKNHAIGISFIPTTEAYQRYGPNVTIDVILSNQEMEEMIKNYSSKPPINTSGQVKAKALVTGGLTEEQIMNLENIGFHTNEILETRHL